MDDHGPFWLAALPDVGGQGVDRLWLRQPGLAMANVLLPGITNTTNRARVYSVIAWMFANARTEAGLRPMENLYLQLMRWHGAKEGHRVEGAGSSAALARLGPLELQLGPGKTPPSVLDPAQYGPSAKALGIGARHPGDAPELSRLGLRLAESIGIPKAVVPKPDAATIPADCLPKLVPLCCCQPPTVKERAILEELLFRMEERRSESWETTLDGPRRRSMALVLHQAHGLPVQGARARIFQWCIDVSLGRKDDPVPLPLAETVWGFAAMGGRWFLRHALETVWAGFGRLLRRHDHPGPSTLPWVAEVLNVADADDPWLPESEGTLADVLDVLGDHPGREFEGLQHISSLLGSRPEEAMLAATTQLAILGDLHRRLGEQDAYYSEFLRLGQVERVSSAHLARRASPELTVAAWAALVLERYVVGQHLLAASYKEASGSFAYNFHRTDQGFELVQQQWGADAGPTKVLATLNLLRDIGLLVEDDRQWKRTALGDDLLKRVIEDPGKLPGEGSDGGV